MDLNFTVQENATRTSKRQLTPYTVHTVSFKGAEIKEVGKDTKYRILSISFENETGVANMSIFWPTEKDAERPIATAKDGHEYYRASRWDNTKAVIAQTIQALTQEGFAKFQEVSKKFRSFDDMANAFVAIVNKMKDKQVKVKFSGYTNKEGYQQLSFPTIVGINKEGEAFISDNYIGEDVVLSAYEIKKASEAPKPTEMKKDEMLDTKGIDNGTDGFDLGDLNL